MKIQSLSVCVPGKNCINACKFCVSRMHNNDYPSTSIATLDETYRDKKDYINRLEFARDNGCNTVMLTGCCEPQQNRLFLEWFAKVNQSLEKPFRWIEMQTTGVLLNDEYLTFLRNIVGVSTISISLSSFNDNENASICQMRTDVNIRALCKMIKDHGFNLRISVNLNSVFNDIASKDMFKILSEELNADQVTFRVLYSDSTESPEGIWIHNHEYSRNRLYYLVEYIKKNGTKLEKLSYGQQKYSVDGMCIVIDDDCMSKGESNTDVNLENSSHDDMTDDNYKYLILRPNGHLYSRWDDRASLIF